MKCTNTVIVDTSRSPYAKLRPVSIENVRLEGGFWAPRLQALQSVTIPSQYQILKETGEFFNFLRASGKSTGERKGLRHHDANVFKWIEAAAFSLASIPNPGLQNLLKQIVAEIIAAQDEDGYLNTYFVLEKKKDRWTNLRWSHELFSAGHLMQAAIAYYRATGEKELLNAAVRFADHIADVFGPGKLVGVDGHPEVEMALVELYRTTSEEKYLHLAQFFLNNRGQGLVGGSELLIDHKPFRKLSEIVGHAVCAVYLNCGACDIYLETGENALWQVLDRLWRSMTRRKMYVTGGIGSRYHPTESFGADYELPNTRAYTETCAAIGSIMWNWRMLLATAEAKYADIMELALYNAVLSQISLDGTLYFYENHLADRGDLRRQKWFSCPCCPPNLARFFASLPGYLYSLAPEGIYVHLYAQNTAHLELGDNSVTLIERTNYPWDGKVNFVLQPTKETYFSLYLRIPSWCRKAEVKVNRKPLSEHVLPEKYFEIRRVWRHGDHVQVVFPMPIERIVSHPHLLENTDKVALRRGPMIYCIEQVDNPDFDVWNIILPDNSSLRAEWMPDLLGGIMAIVGEAFAVDVEKYGDRLYHSLSDAPTELRRVKFTAIPYYAWANREQGPMIVWIRRVPNLSLT